MWVYITSFATTILALLELEKDWREHKTTARRVAVLGLIVFTGIGGVLGTYFTDKAADKRHQEDQAKITQLQTTIDAGNANLNARLDKLELILEAQLEQATPSSPYMVRLWWQPSEPSQRPAETAVGYYLYRSLRHGDPRRTRLNSVPITTTFYDDHTVAAGSTYYYVVTGVNALGAESRPSNEIRKEVPPPPR
jgi:hypothetical protein